MNLLFDTHIFIWSTSDAARLSDRARQLIADPQHTKWFSLVSAWEMQIKSQIGKLTFQKPLDVLIDEQQRVNGLQILPIQLAHITTLSQLPLHHRDPFDRLLIAQAVHHDFVLVSHDGAFEQYDVRLVW